MMLSCSMKWLGVLHFALMASISIWISILGMISQYLHYMIIASIASLHMSSRAFQQRVFDFPNINVRRGILKCGANELIIGEVCFDDNRWVILGAVAYIISGKIMKSMSSFHYDLYPSSNERCAVLYYCQRQPYRHYCPHNAQAGQINWRYRNASRESWCEIRPTCIWASLRHHLMLQAMADLHADRLLMKSSPSLISRHWQMMKHEAPHPRYFRAGLHRHMRFTSGRASACRLNDGFSAAS